MATKISTIIQLAKDRMVFPVGEEFWSDQELAGLAGLCFKDLWRPIADLRQEHFLAFATISLPANTGQFIGVPNNVHKVYLIEPADLTESSANRGLHFKPLDWNHPKFRSARSRSVITPENDIIFYAITAPGSPVGPPIIKVAPQSGSAVTATLSYIPTLQENWTTDDFVPIPGEADNAVVAWVVAFARGKETEDRSPDPNWLTIYSTEKANLLASLGLRQLQENEFVDGLFEEEWP